MMSRDEELLAQHIREAMPGTLAVVLVGELHAAFRAERERWAAEMAHQQRETRKAHAEVVARAEKAEKERDEARADLVEACNQRDEQKIARERAEADNGALLLALRDVVARWPTGEMTVSRSTHETIANADHPGAALLEHLRALEWVREAAEPYRAKEGATDAEETSEDGWELVIACASADALKGKP
jgi:hypothetical protein